MSAVVEKEILRDILVERARITPTDSLRATYRDGLELMAGNPALTPWHDTMDAVRIVLRERIAADWLHRNRCETETCDQGEEHLAFHESYARAITEAFETGRGFAESVCRGLDPFGPPVTAREAAAQSKQGAFRALISHLVAVVPSEVTA